MKSFKDSYLYDSTFYCIALGVLVVFYLLDHELDLVTKLTPLFVYARKLSFAVISFLNPTSFLYGLTSVEWNVQSYLSLFFLILITSFVALNVGEDYYNKYKEQAEYNKVVSDRSKNSSCKKIKPRKFQQETDDQTRRQVQALVRSDAYGKYMAARDN